MLWCWWTLCGSIKLMLKPFCCFLFFNFSTKLFNASRIRRKNNEFEQWQFPVRPNQYRHRLKVSEIPFFKSVIRWERTAVIVNDFKDSLWYGRYKRLQKASCNVIPSGEDGPTKIIHIHFYRLPLASTPKHFNGVQVERTFWIVQNNHVIRHTKSFVLRMF